MANNYTETSFMIPCTQAQAIMACHWLDLLADTDAVVMENIRHIIEDDNDTTEFEYMWQRAIYILRDMPQEGRNEWLDGFWSAGFDYQPCSDGIWIKDNGESIDSDAADMFIATVLDFFNSDELVCYSAANTCSKKRLDEFGGFAVAVSRNGVEGSMGTWQWMHEQRERFKAGSHKL